jgi:hypothetical protein
MKKLNLKAKLFYGYIGASVLLSILTVAVSLLARVDWYYHLATPGYLYQQLLFTGFALHNWWQVVLSGVLLCAQLCGAIFGLCGQKLCSKVLLLPQMIVHCVVMVIPILFLVLSDWYSLLRLPLSVLVTLLLNVALLALWRPMTKES